MLTRCACLMTLAALTWTLGLPGSAQTLKNGGASGVVTTRTGVVPASGTLDIYTTPADAKGGVFILTQVCVEDADDLELSGSSLGTIVMDGDCAEFTPGLAIPSNETLTFTDTNNTTQDAFITGILSKK